MRQLRGPFRNLLLETADEVGKGFTHGVKAAPQLRNLVAPANLDGYA